MATAEPIPPGGGEIIGDSADRRVEILCDHDALNATLSRFGPGRDGAGLHVHRTHSDLFYVLEGTLTVRLGVEDRAVEVPAGALARVPPGVVHGFRNASAADMRYVNLHAPGRRFNDYLRALRDGRRFAYDQYDPPPDRGVPASAAYVGEPVCDTPELQVAVRSGAPAADGARLAAVFVLSGELVVDGRPAPAGTWATLAPGGEVAGAAQCLHVRVP